MYPALRYFYPWDPRFRTLIIFNKWSLVIGNIEYTHRVNYDLHIAVHTDLHSDIQDKLHNDLRTGFDDDKMSIFSDSLLVTIKAEHDNIYWEFASSQLFLMTKTIICIVTCMMTCTMT